MRNLKKLLAVIVSICIIATITVPAFAAGISEEAQICADLGLLEGDAGAVDETYLGKETQRYQAAIIYLRLFGLEEEALAYEGEDNFSDAKEMKWAEGRNILAYLYDNPELGWVGDAGKFDPYALATPQMIYKVLLTALGYEEDVDFTWDETLEFAEEKGLSAIADVENITNDDLAAAIVEALKVNVKGSDKTLVEKLVEDGLIDKDAAIDAGLIEPVPEVVTVSSVYANNRKQVVVEFNGAVDKATAENKDNYSIDTFSFKSASLSADGKTVTLTLNESESLAFANQKEYKITIDGLKDASGKAIAKADKVAFYVADTTIPSVEEVVALGTKALKVVFSEPVKGTSAATTAVYKIDGKSIAGSVKYIFPKTVIISTTMTTGDHKLSVDGVKDYNDFKVYQQNIDFTVVEDTTAPEIVSAKAIDLKKVEVVFNEPVKAVSKAYHTSSSRTGTISIDDTKVTINFTDANRMTVNLTTITLENVEDYSGNKATRTVDVTPELDTERPTVTGVKVEKDSSNHKFTVTFSESVKEADAETGANYVIKDKDGKAVSGKGLNAKGSPSTVTYDDTKKQAVFTLAGLLGAGEYTIEISGIQDSAYVANTMIPYSEAFTIGDTTAPTLKRAWLEETPVDSKYDAVIYVQFSEEMAIDGNGNVVDKFKYNICDNFSTPSWKPIPTDSVLEMVTTDTLKITLPRSTTSYAAKPALGIRVALVSDAAGNFLGANSDYVGTIAVTGIGSINITGAKATAKDTIEVVFDGVLTNIDTNDFIIDKTTDAAVRLESYSHKDGNTTAIFKVADGEEKLTASADSGSATFKVTKTNAADVATQDVFGRKVSTTAAYTISDAIKPESIDYAENKPFDFVNASGSYTARVKFNEAINLNATATEIVSVKIDGVEALIRSMSVSGTDLILDLGAPVKKSAVTTSITIDASNSIIDVELKEANDTAKIVVDLNNNAAVSFTRSAKITDVD